MLYVAGLGMNQDRPEEDPVNFLPRIHVPVLMLSGKYDSVFPYESSQLPFFRLLGTPASAKKQIVFEGGPAFSATVCSSSPFTVWGCVLAKGCGCKSATSMPRADAYTFATPRATEIASCRCQMPPWPCYATSGPFTATRC